MGDICHSLPKGQQFKNVIFPIFTFAVIRKLCKILYRISDYRAILGSNSNQNSCTPKGRVVICSSNHSVTASKGEIRYRKHNSRYSYKAPALLPRNGLRAVLHQLICSAAFLQHWWRQQLLCYTGTILLDNMTSYCTN